MSFRSLDRLQIGGQRVGVADDFSYLSTAGGAFLDWPAGKTLPSLAALEI